MICRQSKALVKVSMTGQVFYRKVHILLCGAVIWEPDGELLDNVLF